MTRPHHFAAVTVLIPILCWLTGTAAAQDSDPPDELATVIGQVTDPATGFPIPDACVSTEPFEVEPPTVTETVTDANGMYTLTNVVPGFYSIEFDDCGVGRYGTYLSPLIEILPGPEPTVIDAHLDPFGRIEGTVREDLIGVEGVCVLLDVLTEVVTGPDGTFQVDGLEPGEHIVEVAGCGEPDPVYAPHFEILQVAPGEVVRLWVDLVRHSDGVIIEIANPVDEPDTPLVLPAPALPATGFRSQLAPIGACLVLLGGALRRAGRALRRGGVAGP